MDGPRAANRIRFDRFRWQDSNPAAGPSQQPLDRHAASQAVSHDANIRLHDLEFVKAGKQTGKPFRENQAATLFLLTGHGAIRLVLGTSTVAFPVLINHPT